jgi:TetR/AcrR family transcriptional repressor of bet genes
MPRKSNTEDRRTEIVIAMMKVVAANGYERATIQQIANAADLTSGLLHYHFSNKQEILIALAQYLAGYVRQRFEQLAADATGAEDRLRAYLDARLGFGEGSSVDAVGAWVVIGSEAIRQPEVREVYQEAIAFEMKLVKGLLVDYLEQRKKSTRDVGKLTAVVLAFIEGAFQLSRTADRIMPRRYAANAAFEIVERFAKAGAATR